jgi:hypothetical protein
MATSPNFGWSEPDDTSFVKNGALAMRTLGNSIDTTMQDTWLLILMGAYE